VQQVTLRYFGLQEDKIVYLRITFDFVEFLLSLADFEIFRMPLKSGAIAWMWRKPKSWRICCNFGSAGKVSLTINIALGETVADVCAVVMAE
jgi:hypothetical protein